MPKNAQLFLCESCDFKCCKKSNYDVHILTSKHIKANNANNNAMDLGTFFVSYNETKSCEKVAYKFYYEKCDYYTSKKSIYYKHLLTDKHL